MHKKPGRNTIALLGIGHTNAYILRMWKMQPIANAELVCISNFPMATYSGMLPGVLAGQYPPSQMEIDLVRLAASADAQLIIDEVVGLDPERHRLQFAHRPPLYFELLSIGIGSVPSFQGVTLAEDAPIVSIKPMQTFLDRFRTRLANVHPTDRPLRIVIVGGGVGSVEIAFCLQSRLRSDDPQWGSFRHEGLPPVLTLVTGSEEITPDLTKATREKVVELLRSKEIRLLSGSRATRIDADHIELETGERVDADIVLWATSAAPSPLISKTGLATESDGFISIKPTLQTISEDGIFAVGDCATLHQSDPVKAGVYAVRQGPILWDNLNRSLWQRPLRNYVPQDNFLKLINTGDNKVIAEFKGRSVYSRWAWKLKHRIDSQFMAMYQDYEPMKVAIPEEETEREMRCLGCGGKVGSELLTQVLADLDIPPHDDVIIGLETPDDAAIIKTYNNQVTTTVDFFASPLKDPYHVGRIALLNSASDCFVMGAQPTAALAMIQLPFGHPRSQLRIMRDVMTGAVEELKGMNATLIGGHSIEGPRLMVGFTILGKQSTTPNTKGMLQPGDRLILSKPLGTGVLLSALMYCRLKGTSYQPLLETMLQSNAIALPLIESHHVSAVTDVTGFGLAGHLAEMLKASHVSAEINLNAIPMLPGTQALIDDGIESTLTPDNRLVAQKIHLEIDKIESPENAILFDPQTGGGLLIGAAESEAENVIRFLRDHQFDQAAIIGTVTPVTDRLTLKVIAS